MKKIILIIMILGGLIIANAQTEKNELKLTSEIEKMLVTAIYSDLIQDSDERLSNFGIKNRSQLENLQLGKPIPMYYLINNTIKFRDRWQVPVLSDGEPLFLARVFPDNGGQYRFANAGAVPLAKSIYNYEHKNLITGFLGVTSYGGMDYLMIRKEDKDIFVQRYDYATHEFLKNEHSLSEIIIANAKTDKYEMKLTPEITEMVASNIYSCYIKFSDKSLSDVGVENRSQLENIQLGKPIPMYILENENLIFMDRWRVPVMSDGDLLFLTDVMLKDDGQYRWIADGGGAMLAKAIHNYEYKNLIIGYLDDDEDYLIIRKENQDIYVQRYDYETREYFKHEYSLREVINLIKK